MYTPRARACAPWSRRRVCRWCDDPRCHHVQPGGARWTNSGAPARPRGSTSRPSHATRDRHGRAGETTATSPTAAGETPFCPFRPSPARIRRTRCSRSRSASMRQHASSRKYPTTVRPSLPVHAARLPRRLRACGRRGRNVAFKPITEQIRIGVGFEALVGKLESDRSFSASPQDPCSPRQRRARDAKAKLSTSTISAPSAHFGVTAVPHEKVHRRGRAPAVQDRRPAELKVTSPRATAFDSATQTGTGTCVKTDLPATPAWGGGEADLTRSASRRLVRELWNVRKELAIQPDDAELQQSRGSRARSTCPRSASRETSRPRTPSASAAS